MGAGRAGRWGGSIQRKSSDRFDDVVALRGGVKRGSVQDTLVMFCWSALPVPLMSLRLKVEIIARLGPHHPQPC